MKAAPALPPGPSLPAVVQTVLFKNLRQHTLHRLRRRYGDVIRLRLVPNGRVVLLADVDHIKEVFAGAVTTYHGGEGNDMVKPVMGERSIMLTDEDEHRRARRLLLPAFSPAALRGYRAGIEALAAEEADRWPIGVPVNSFERLCGFTLEVMLRIGFGFAPGPRLDRARTLVRGVVDVGPVDIIGLHSQALRRRGRWRRYLRLLRDFDDIVYAEIAERRAAPDTAGRTDLLSRMVTASAEMDVPPAPAGAAAGGPAPRDAELRDHVVSMLLAGQETSATALAWALHDLARDPVRQQRAAAAAVRDEAAYLDHVFKEALRLHPVISEVSRTLTHDVEIGGHRIPAGYDVMVGIALVQLDPANHDAPREFRPERFTEEDTPVGTWLPFGGGARRCLGAGMAMLEGTIMLQELLRRHRLVPDRPQREKLASRHVIQIPARGATVIAVPR